MSDFVIPLPGNRSAILSVDHEKLSARDCDLVAAWLGLVRETLIAEPCPLEALYVAIVAEEERLKTRDTSYTEDYQRGMRHALSRIAVELQTVRAKSIK